MASYFTGEKVTKAAEARINVEKYYKDRQQLLENYITQVITELTAQIVEVSRKEGKVRYDFNYCKIKVNEAELKQYKIKFKEFNDEEHQKIRERILSFLKEEGFTVSSEPEYVSRYNRTHIKITWE